METLTEFVIPFVGLKDGQHSFDFDIDTTFFNAFEYEDFDQPNVKVKLLFDKKPGLLNLRFKAQGNLGLTCDVSNEIFDHHIETTLDWIVKFGDEYNDDNDEVLVLPYGSYQVNVAQPIYEMIVLAVPIKKIHPGVVDGTLDSALLKKLEELQPKEVKSEENDPRWDKLKELL